MNLRLFTWLFKPDAKKEKHWLSVLLPVAVFISFDVTQACAKIIDSVADIPVGPGQVCVKYANYYSSLIDWLGGPAEMTYYRYVSYDNVVFHSTVHSCAGGVAFPGTLPEGIFLLLQGGLVYQAAIVNIERIDDKCPYILTYYWLTNPVVIPDPDGTCVKGLPPDKNKNQGVPDICQ